MKMLELKRIKQVIYWRTSDRVNRHAREQFSRFSVRR